MPVMDGMTALQHLMIHRPTPTIMFSSLTEEGTARSFDTIKNGAIDFISKDFIFNEKSNPQENQKLIVDKVQRASRVKMGAREPVLTSSQSLGNLTKDERRVIFCEDCGHREVISVNRSQPLETKICSQCGDVIDLTLTAQAHYQQSVFVTVMGGGEGSFFNLLEIIPNLDAEMGGTLIVVIHGSAVHIDAFTEYLNSISAMKVVRARDGMNIEGGYCYIATDKDYISITGSGAQLTLQSASKSEPDFGPIDTLISSVSSVLKNKMAGIILSGEQTDGDKGIAILQKNGAIPVLLDSRESFCKKMGKNVAMKCLLDQTCNSATIVEMISELHCSAQNDNKEG